MGKRGYSNPRDRRLCGGLLLGFLFIWLIFFIWHWEHPRVQGQHCDPLLQKVVLPAAEKSEIECLIKAYQRHAKQFQCTLNDSWTLSHYFWVIGMHKTATDTVGQILKTLLRSQRRKVTLFSVRGQIDHKDGPAAQEMPKNADFSRPSDRWLVFNAIRTNPYIFMPPANGSNGSFVSHDVPLSSLYREIDSTYPNSKFLFTWRDPRLWFQSACHFFNTHHLSFAYLHGSRLLPFESKEVADKWYNDYVDHAFSVLSYFWERPCDLLLLNVDAEMTWDDFTGSTGFSRPVNKTMASVEHHPVNVSEEQEEACYRSYWTEKWREGHLRVQHTEN